MNRGIVGRYLSRYIVENVLFYSSLTGFSIAFWTGVVLLCTHVKR